MYEVQRIYKPSEDAMVKALARLITCKTTSDSFHGNALVVEETSKERSNDQSKD